MTTSESQRGTALGRRVKKTLSKLGWNVVEDASIQGVPVDLAVQLPNGRTAVVDVKSWTPEAYGRVGSWWRALSQRFGELGVLSVIVLDESRGRYPVGGQFLFETQLAGYLESLGNSQQQVAHGAAAAMIEKPATEVFVAMPFAKQYSDVYWNAIRPAAHVVRSKAYREDYSGSAGDALARIKDHIAGCTFVAADITQLRPNVMFELGWALSKSKRVVIIAERATPLPFDVSHERVTWYESHDKRSLRLALNREFRKAMRDLGHLPR